jgi:hypothetical protein
MDQIKKLRNNKNGISTVFGSMLFLIIVMVIASTLFIGLYNHNKTTREGTRIEEIRSREKITICDLETNLVDETLVVTTIEIMNLGSKAVKIAAVYVDNSLIAETATVINTKSSNSITLDPPMEYDSESIITVTTDKGVRSSIEEGDLVENYQVPTNDEFYFGPLRLDFEEFYYLEITDQDYDPEPLNPGWNPGPSTTLVWRINVTNVDARDLLLTGYSCLTLIDNSGGNQKPWYIERVQHADGTNSSIIESQENVMIFYRWDNPETKKEQSTFANDAQCRVILTFFGTFQLSNNRQIPYGQTIPFEAVLIEK